MSENVITLQELILTLHQSLEKANEALEHEYLNHISEYFDEKGTPLTKSFVIETPSGERRKLEIPLMSLTNLSPLVIKDVNITLSAYFLGADEDNNLLLSLTKPYAKQNCSKIDINITLNPKNINKGC